MTPRPHTVPHALFDAFARGGGGPEGMRLLVAARRSRTAQLVRAAVLAAGRPAAAATRQAFETLKDERQVARADAEAVLTHPFTGAWAMRAATSGEPGAGLQMITIAAALRSGAEVTLPLGVDVAELPLPTLGTAAVRGSQVRVRPVSGGTELRTEHSSVVVPADPARPRPGWRPAPALGPFLLEDAAPDYLPAELRARPALAPEEVSLWRARIEAGWDLLREHHEEVAEELGEAIRVLVPLPTPARGLTSVTLADAFGAVFLSLPADAEAAALVLAHELQHAKLSVLLDLFQLFDADGELFYAPWRADPRPFVGLLHGTYAHLGVAAFWRRQRNIAGGAASESEFARWREAAHQACGTMLGSGKLTVLGEALVSAMTDLLTRWRTEPVSADAARRADEAARLHRTRWLVEHRPV